MTAQGFRAYKQTGIPLGSGLLPTIDVALQVGAQEQVVEVTGEAPLIDVTVTKSQTNVTQAMIADVPVGRSFQSAISFAPSARSEPLQGNGYSVAGAAQTENQYLIEGQDTGGVIYGTSNSNTPFEFIQEVQVKSSGIEAEHAGALGGVVNVIQKRGGNSWHGAVWAYYEPSSWDAAPSRTIRQDPSGSLTCPVGGTCLDYAVQTYQPKKDKFTYIQPGVSVGGPIIKDRLWFFAGFDPQYYKRDRTVDMNVLSTVYFGPDNFVGPNTFTTRTTTYYGTSRVDYLVTQKIRVFSSWLYQYYRGEGIQVPTADSVDSLYNPSATAPMTGYLAAKSEVSPNQLFNVGGDVTITPSLVATTRFGYSFQNDGYRGYPPVTSYQWRTNGSTATDLLGNSVGGVLAQHDFLYANSPVVLIPTFDASKKHQFTQDLAWFKKAFGTHNIKGGYAYNKLYNTTNQQYFDSVVRVYPGSRYLTQSAEGAARCQSDVGPENLILTGGAQNGVTVSGTSVRCRGMYGYAIAREFATTGTVKSGNHGFYIQDAWTIGKGLTINGGFRLDKEYLPADPSLGLDRNPIDFSWGDKMAPRIGAAWDVFQNGKMKVFGSYGIFFDQMKLGLARSSFGGDYWHNCIYALNTNTPQVLLPVRTGTGNHYCTGDVNQQASWQTAPTPDQAIFIENLDLRSTGGAEVVDPNIKPYKQHENVFGVDYQIAKSWAFEARWDRRRLDRVIEDAGLLYNGSEIFEIVNPGYGDNKDVTTSAKALFGVDNGCPDCPANPKAVRNYDGVEMRLTHSMAQHWFGQFSYTYSKLRGNYSGLTSSDLSDGAGRVDPNNNRSFDEPYFSYTAYGKAFNGLLATDRPHTFKAFGSYNLPWKKWGSSNIGLFQQVFSGTPLSTYMDVGAWGGYPVYVEGRGKWVDVTADPTTGLWSFSAPRTKRTPSFSQTDLRFATDFKLSQKNEQQVLSFEFNITNLFNQRSVLEYTSQMNTNNDSTAISVNDVTINSAADYATYMKPYDYKTLVNQQSVILNSLYGKPLAYQSNRAIRLRIGYAF